MNENTVTPAESTFKPYVSPETEMVESTIGAIVVGSILGIIFAAASVYAGLKVGLTTSASIPIAVISITVFRLFGKSTILKNNIVQTTGSAGESLAAGVAFTLPSLLLMGFDLDFIRITLVALLGGALGILMMIPLRHGLMVKEHGKLSYPEGTACAQVLIVGEKGGSGASSLFFGLCLGGLFAAVGRIGRFFAETPTWMLDRVPWGGKFVSLLKGGSMSFETNPVLLGTGYIIGWRTSFIMMAGGMLSFLVFIPAIQFFGPNMTSQLYGDDLHASAMSLSQLRNAFVLYIGAGAVATGGLISLLKSMPTIVGAFTRGLSNFGGRAGKMPLRTERDLPMSVVVVGSLALVLAIWAPNLLKQQIGRDILGINWLSAILIVVFGFFFVTVSSRITGEIGSSSNPISGMTVATLLVTCLLFVAVKWTGIAYKEMALCTAALVCVAASNGGTTSQDLKTGFLVGSTPRKQQIAIMWGVLTSSAVIGFTLLFLNDNLTTYHARTVAGFSATPAAMQKLAAEGRDDEVAIGGKQTWRGVEYDDVYVRKDQIDPNDPAHRKVILRRGKYLAMNGAVAWYVDPGICGTETEQLAPDGKTVERKVTSKFDAPKAQLFRLIIDGVLGGDLPWTLVMIGVFIAIILELCGVSSLPFAVGAYLPLSTSAAIFIGGLARKWSDRKTGVSEAEQESSPGVLFSSGLIAGGALAGILSCALAAPKTIVHNNPDGTTTREETTVGETFSQDHFPLEISSYIAKKDETVDQLLTRTGLDTVKPAFYPTTLAQPVATFFDENKWWGFSWYIGLGFILYLVAAVGNRRKAAPPEPEAPLAPPPPGMPGAPGSTGSSGSFGSSAFGSSSGSTPGSSFGSSFGSTFGSTGGSSGASPTGSTPSSPSGPRM